MASLAHFADMTQPTVLLAEDEEADVIFMRRAFATLQLPYCLAVVRCGAEAIRYLAGEGDFADRAKHPVPAMLILDMRMPNKTGIEVIQWLKAQIDLPPLFVVTLTGTPRFGKPCETLERHEKTYIFNCYFIKPIEEENLVSIMRMFESWRKNF
jgi:CheY-like chemotaxis protein